MAACHPKLSTHPGAELFLSRFAEGEWLGVVRPWLEGARVGWSERSSWRQPAVRPTLLSAGASQESLPLLGVEFLTPGLARKKRGAGSDPGKTFHLLVLRTLIEARLGKLGPDDPARLLWKSIGSDLEAALGDFDDLLRAGLSPEDFPKPELQGIFRELLDWMGRRGFEFDPIADRAAASSGRGSAIADRMLLLPGGAESRGEFFGLAALATRCPALTVSLPMPDFARGGDSDEAWVGTWERFLGVSHEVPDVPDPLETCAGVAEVWAGAQGMVGQAEVIVGRSRSHEMERVADRIAGLLRSGSDNVAVIFPKADAAHEQLARILDERGTVFTDLIAASATVPVEIQTQRAMVDFYAKGCRLEELLALWPLLEARSLVRISAAEARAICQGLFDEVQSHRVEPHMDRLEKSEKNNAREVGRVLRLLLPSWPQALSLSEALALFESARNRLMASAPAGWEALHDFAARAAEPMPSAAVLEAIRSFIPENGPALGEKRNGYAHVTLTTVRRASGVAWSETILVESRKGSWPQRRESTCWLGDGDRRERNAEAPSPAGLATADERVAIERRMYAAVARDTRHRVIFSVSEHADEDPEARLEPNPWLERVLWGLGHLSVEVGGRHPFGRPAPARPAPKGHAQPGLATWFRIWNRRRDPQAKFDDHFFSGPASLRPVRLSAGLIERGVADPVRLWFEAVLGVRRVEWGPFERERGKQIGNAVHGLLARALKGLPSKGAFFEMPARGEAMERLSAEVSSLRERWPRDRYWDSVHMEVAGAARSLLEKVFGLPKARYAAVESWLPEGATVPAGEAGPTAVRGRMDLVLSDRPDWEGASVHIVDYKTGSDAGLSAKAMASRGASLQLGIYLEAARSLKAQGSVWMLKPDKPPSSLETDELEGAVAKLKDLGLHLKSGVYGALTPDRTEHSHDFAWPLACPPIPAAILRRKFDATFGAVSAAGSEGGGDE